MDIWLIDQMGTFLTVIDRLLIIMPVRQLQNENAPNKLGHMVNLLVDHLPWKESGPGHFGDRRKQRHSTVSIQCLWAPS